MIVKPRGSFRILLLCAWGENCVWMIIVMKLNCRTLLPLGSNYPCKSRGGYQLSGNKSGRGEWREENGAKKFRKLIV